MTAPSLVLVGPAGSDAAAVGEAAGRLLGLPVTDTERQAAAALGYDDVSVAYVVAGEQAFAAAETAAAVTALSAPGVVVLGSGAPVAQQVQNALAGLPLVRLTVSLAHAAPRLGLATARPVFLGNPRAAWVRLAGERDALYATLTDRCVDTDDRTPDEVAELAIATLQERS